MGIVWYSLLFRSLYLLFFLSLTTRADLTAQVWNNVVFAPLNGTSRVVTVPNVTLPSSLLSPLPDYSSVRFIGTITPILTDTALNFSAVSEGGVRLWIDDFLIIDAGYLHNSTVSAVGRTAIQTIPVQKDTPLAFRLEYSRWNSSSGTVPTLTLYWQGASIPFAMVPDSAFQSTVSPSQSSIMELRDRLIAPSQFPWQTYYRRSMTGHTLTPTGLVIVASFIDSVTNSVLGDIFIQRGGSSYISRAGLHSRNGSDYSQLNIWNWNNLDCNVTMETTVTSAPNYQLQFLASSIGNDCGRLRLLIQPTMFDERIGWALNSSVTEGFLINLPGFSTVYVNPAGTSPIPINTTVIPPNNVPYFALPLVSSDGTVVGYCADTVSSSSPCPTVSEMIQNIANARILAAAESSSYGELSAVYDGIATGVLWNTIFSVHEGVISIVSRNPNWAGNSEFVADYVLFEWDSYFIALQAAVDNSTLRDIGISTLVQVTLARTPRGFVPNWKSGAHSSYDRTENQVGALVSLTILNMLPDNVRSWVLDLIFPPLLTWHQWVWSSRMAIGGILNGEPLMILGSDPSSPHDNGDGNMQGARYESMDNSPAYDAPPISFNSTTHQIQQYDVSPTALFLSDTDALMTLATIAGRTDVLPLLHSHFNATTKAMNSYLWLDQLGTYANKLFNGTWNPRLNPSSFYPLLAGVVSEQQAITLATLLTDPLGFCVNASHTPGITIPTDLLTRWYSRNSHHSYGCVTNACTSPVLLYDRATFEGVEATVPVYNLSSSSSIDGGVMETLSASLPFPNAVPLNIYVSATLGNATALAIAPPDNTFVFQSQEGWCFSDENIPSGMFRTWSLTNLTLWNLSTGTSHDYRTCGTSACELSSQQQGYTMLSRMCVAFDSSNVSTLPCKVPVPSIARGDPNFLDQNYWRGRTWAPQAILVYLGLLRYDHIPILRNARMDLITLGKNVMLNEWLEYGHIVENMNGMTGISQDSGNADPFYAWGGSFGLPAILETLGGILSRPK